MSNIFTSLVRIGSEPELRYTASGTAALSFSAAVSVGFGDKQKTMWFRVTYWRNPEKIQPFLHKGDQCVVSGELSQNEYKANDGTTKTSLEINANILDLVGKKNDNGGQSQPASQPSSNQRSYAPEPAKDNFDDFDDSLPFN